MTRFLAYTTPNLGHLFPLVPILAELRARGHEVTVCTRSDQRAALEEIGLDFVALDPRIEAMAPDDWQKRGAVGAVAQAIRFAAARGTYELDQLERVLPASSPHALIIDPSSFGAFARPQAGAVPWAVYSPFPLMMRSVDVPPYGPGLRPGSSPVARARDAVIRRLAQRAYRNALQPAQELRARVGLPPARDIDHAWRASSLVLLLSAEPFEYPRSDWPTNMQMVGPCSWEPSREPLPWLEGERRPIILVTASSQFQDDAALLHTAFETFAGQDVLLVATAAAHDPSSFRPPPNARIARHLPHAQIIDRASCVITHGGMGITQKALAAGVPVCAVPFMRDQFEVARRVEVCGAGTRLPAKRLTPDRLRKAVDEAIRRRDGAMLVKDAFARAGGASAAADALETLHPTAPAPGVGTSSPTGFSVPR